MGGVGTRSGKPNMNRPSTFDEIQDRVLDFLVYYGGWLPSVVVLAAAGRLLAREFDEGLPPRFVMRRIPGRIKRLQPGMTAAQAKEILGLKNPWFLGGIGVPRGGR